MNPYPAGRSILVMDNCRIHHNIDLVDVVNAAGKQLHHLISESGPTPILNLGCLLIYLPLYSPDLNPIEESFSTCECPFDLPHPC
jgi:transposase